MDAVADAFRHYLVFGGLDTSFIFDEGILFGLLLVMRVPAKPSFRPILLESSRASLLLFFLRLRNPTSALPVNS